MAETKKKPEFKTSLTALLERPVDPLPMPIQAQLDTRMDPTMNVQPPQLGADMPMPSPRQMPAPAQPAAVDPRMTTQDMTNQRVEGLQGQINQLDNPKPLGFWGTLGQVAQGISTMDPAQFRQLQQQKIGQEYAQKQQARQNLVAQLKDTLDREAQGRQGAIADEQRQYEMGRRPVQEQMDALGLQAANQKVTAGERALTAPTAESHPPGTLIITRDATGKEISREQVPFKEAPTQQPNTPFEVWQQQNQGKSVEDWLKLNRPPAAPASEPLVQTMDESGNVTWTPRSQASGQSAPKPIRPANEAERGALGMYERMKNATAALDELEPAIAGLGLLGQTRLNNAPNAMQSPEGKRFNQAAGDFINAALRRESGAAISNDEYARFGKIYFPLPGDDAQTLAQKKAARNTVISSAKTSAGTAYTDKYGEAGDAGDELEFDPATGKLKGKK